MYSEYFLTGMGKNVYHSTGYSKAWDGTLNGRRLPSGTYYYIIDQGKWQAAIIWLNKPLYAKFLSSSKILVFKIAPGIWKKLYSYTVQCNKIDW